MTSPEADPLTPLDSLLRPHRRTDGRWQGTIPDGWQQGRGAFGGLALGLMVRVGEATVAPSGPGRTLRSLTGELLGPVEPGPLLLVAEVLRDGSNVTTVAIRATQSDAVLGHAVCVLGRDRATLADAAWMTPPELPPWRGSPTHAFGPPFAPPFTAHWEYRVTGPLPFAGAPEPVAAGWIRPRRPGTARDAAYLVACADAWWPAFFSTETSPRPVGTLAYTLQIAGSCAGLDPDAPLAYRGRILASHGGFAVEQRELWGEDGRLLALNQQTVVAIR